MPRISAYQPSTTYLASQNASYSQAGQGQTSATPPKAGANNPQTQAGYPPSYYYPPVDEPMDAGQGLNPGQVVKDTQKLLQGNPLKKAWNWLKQNWLTVVLVIGGSYLGFQGIKMAGSKLGRLTAPLRGVTPEKQIETHNTAITSLLSELENRSSSIATLQAEVTKKKLGGDGRRLSEAELVQRQAELDDQLTQYSILANEKLRDSVTAHHDSEQWRLEQEFNKAKNNNDPLAIDIAEAALEGHRNKPNPQRYSLRELIAYAISTHSTDDRLLSYLDGKGYPISLNNSSIPNSNNTVSPQGVISRARNGVSHALNGLASVVGTRA